MLECMSKQWGPYIEQRVPSQLQLGEVSQRYPLIWNAVQANMPIVVALLS